MALNTPLIDEHRAAGARLTVFAGWNLPVQYASSLEEHRAVRTRAGMFDVSHMTITDVTGPQAKALLRRLLCGDVAKLDLHRGRYTCLLAEDAGIIDDLIVYRLEDRDGIECYRLISNGATRGTVRDWLSRHAGGMEVVLEAVDSACLLAVQGPMAASLAAPLIAQQAGVDVAELHEQDRFAVLETPSSFVARTGYTGEDGWEVCIPPDHAPLLWRALRDAGVSPCGLAARDTLRLEAGLALYGTDMDRSTRPEEAGLRWLLDFSDPSRDFIGRQAIEGAPRVTRCRGGIVLEEKGVPRAGCHVRVAEGPEGVITSGSFSPVLGRGIALVRFDAAPGSLPPAPAGATVTIRSREVAARLVRPPFVTTSLAVAGAGAAGGTAGARTRS